MENSQQRKDVSTAERRQTGEQGHQHHCIRAEATPHIRTINPLGRELLITAVALQELVTQRGRAGAAPPCRYLQATNRL